MLERIKSKDTIIGLLVIISLAAIGFSGYTLFNKFKTKYQNDGYASALQQMVQAAETNRELTITVGDKTVTFVVVTPAGTSNESEAK